MRWDDLPRRSIQTNWHSGLCAELSAVRSLTSLPRNGDGNVLFEVVHIGQRLRAFGKADEVRDRVLGHPQRHRPLLEQLRLRVPNR